MIHTPADIIPFGGEHPFPQQQTPIGRLGTYPFSLFRAPKVLLALQTFSSTVQCCSSAYCHDTKSILPIYLGARLLCFCLITFDLFSYTPQLLFRLFQSFFFLCLHTSRSTLSFPGTPIHALFEPYSGHSYV